MHARPETERERADQKRLTALVLWRTAHDHGVLVDDVELRTVRRYYDPVLSARLLTSPQLAVTPDCLAQAMMRLRSGSAQAEVLMVPSRVTWGASARP